MVLIIILSAALALICIGGVIALICTLNSQPPSLNSLQRQANAKIVRIRSECMGATVAVLREANHQSNGGRTNSPNLHDILRQHGSGKS
jgi:hypothetical protein